jgi:hypothetical protein
MQVSFPRHRATHAVPHNPNRQSSRQLSLHIQFTNRMLKRAIIVKKPETSMMFLLKLFIFEAIYYP